MERNRTTNVHRSVMFPDLNVKTHATDQTW